MKQGYTHISVIMDRSGSMDEGRTDTEGGFNAFLTEQKARPGEATISLTTFDNQIELAYAMIPIQDAPVFVLEPRGFTALLDAVGITLTNLKAKIEMMAEEDRPEKVVVVIITDGQENASREYSFGRISAMIKEQSSLGWEFLFLGADQDAIEAGGKLGVARGKSMTYAKSAPGIGSTYSSVSDKLSCFRMAPSSAAMPDFNDADRAAAMADSGPVSKSSGKV